jgi:hypothetical protein
MNQEQEETTRNLCTSSRYTVLASICISREKPEKKRQIVTKKKEKKRTKPESDLLLDEIKQDDGLVTEIMTSVDKIAPSMKKHSMTWFDDRVSEAVKRAVQMHAKSILCYLRECIHENHAMQNSRSMTFNDVRAKALFKVCAYGDSHVVGFTVCSPSDAFNKNFGTQVAIARYERAIMVIKNGKGGKRYVLPMTAELGVEEFGTIVGENDNRA